MRLGIGILALCLLAVVLLSNDANAQFNGCLNNNDCSSTPTTPFCSGPPGAAQFTCMACIANGYVCDPDTFSRQCCSGFLCGSNGLCQPPGQACVPDNGNCNKGGDCCSGACSAAHTCLATPPPVCGAANSSCTSSSQCCSGLSCSSGKCTAPVVACTPLSGACPAANFTNCCGGALCRPSGSTATGFSCQFVAIDPDCSPLSGSCGEMACCGGQNLVCNPGTLICENAATSCAASGAACSASTPCCNPSQACRDDGTSTLTCQSCSGANGVCGATGDCCANQGLTCSIPSGQSTGSCQSSCLDVGATCTSTAQCCASPGLTCGASGRCEQLNPTCNINGQTCSTNSQCCSQKCDLGILIDPSELDEATADDIEPEPIDLGVCVSCWGNSHACSANGDCCSSYCSPTTATCGVEPPANQLPQAPIAPQIGPTPLEVDGTASCLNCGSIVPTVDPDGNYPVRIEYAWLKDGAIMGVRSTSLSAFSCTAFGCQPGNRIALAAYACDNLNGCSQSTSSPLVVAGTAAPVQICESDKFDSVMMLAGIATLAMAALIALAYMAGQALSNPKLSTWAKTEALQALISLAIVGVMLAVLSVFCNMQIGEFARMTGVAQPLIYQGTFAGENVFNGAILYLEHLAGSGLSNLASLRYNLAAYELRTSFNQYNCTGVCLLSLSSWNEAVFSGETMALAITNNLMGTATVGYLSVVFQYFALLYITHGLFIEFLPIAIIIRSVPFMRQFGGALVAIFVALYVLYPTMIVMDAYILPGLSKGVSGGYADLANREGSDPNAVLCNTRVQAFNTATSGIRCVADSESEENIAERAGRTRSDMDNIAASPLPQAIRVNVLIFLAAVFLPALNFIVVAALARDLSHFLGEESDISRLGQMI